jgi:hypothetical protein
VPTLGKLPNVGREGVSNRHKSGLKSFSLEIFVFYMLQSLFVRIPPLLFSSWTLRRSEQEALHEPGRQGGHADSLPRRQEQLHANAQARWPDLKNNTGTLPRRQELLANKQDTSYTNGEALSRRQVEPPSDSVDGRQEAAAGSGSCRYSDTPPRGVKPGSEVLSTRRQEASSDTLMARKQDLQSGDTLFRRQNPASDTLPRRQAPASSQHVREVDYVNF